MSDPAAQTSVGAPQAAAAAAAAAGERPQALETTVGGDQGGEIAPLASETSLR